MGVFPSSTRETVRISLELAFRRAELMRRPALFTFHPPIQYIHLLRYLLLSYDQLGLGSSAALAFLRLVHSQSILSSTGIQLYPCRSI